MYKVIFQNMIIDAIEFPYYVKWIERYGRPFPSDESSANGIGSSDNTTFYHIDGMPCFPEKCNYKTVKLIKITEDEYKTLISSITKGDTVYYDEKEPTKEELFEREIEALKKDMIALGVQLQGMSDNEKIDYLIKENERLASDNELLKDCIMELADVVFA